MSEPIRFTLDGRQVEALPGESIWQVAHRHGTTLPHLCHHDEAGYRSDGNCRACLCAIEGERVLAASCLRRPEPGMKVETTGDRVERARRLVFELLACDMPAREQSPDPGSAFWRWADVVRPESGRLPGPAHVVPACDLSHPAIAVSPEACIACGLCERACREVQVNDVIGMAFRGMASRPVFDLDDAMGESSCVGCGECVQACPTGALIEKSVLGITVETHASHSVDSVCPYCGVGCLTRVTVGEDNILRIDGRPGTVNDSRLCVKGRFGHDYVRHPHRLLRPLVRREDAPKRGDIVVDPGNPWAVFREASWEEALARAAEGFRRLSGVQGPSVLAGFGSAKCSNEEAYLFQKLIRQGFGTNNVDHCTRLCHASSVAALMEGIGSGAVSAPFTAAKDADCIFVIGARPTENHPVAATYIKQAVKAGKTLIVADPRGSSLMRHATHALRFRPGTDVALLNALLNVIVTEGLTNPAFIAEHVENYEAFRDNIREFTPEAMAPVCGIEADVLRQVARAYARSSASLIFWGMGVSQHVHGTDNARCLIALALITGQIGRPGTGLHPLRGQNNVQGASDAGLIPMFYPDYKSVELPEMGERYSRDWGRPLDGKRGLTVVEIIQAAERGDIRGMLIMGENPAMSDPDQIHARSALARLEHLVVQDIFLTETAWHADVVLPASAHAEKLGTFTNTNRQVQLARPALSLPGDARLDIDLLVSLANRLGLGWDYGQERRPDGVEAGVEVSRVYEEMRAHMASLSGLPWERIAQEGSVTYPAADVRAPGQAVLFAGGFPRAGGRGRLVPTSLRPPDEVPDEAFPLVLTTGRLLEHWHTGSMSRRSGVLDALEPEALAAMHPEEIARRGLLAGGTVRVETRRGAILTRLRADRDVAQGMVFVPFAFNEAAANRLTNPALDPYGKIPELKFAAARVTAVPA